MTFANLDGRNFEHFIERIIDLINFYVNDSIQVDCCVY